MDISKRNSALDITRITALFCVISVHFFLNNEYYAEPMMGRRMLIMTVMRTAFMICVPLFITLSGYLLCKKTLSLKYYSGIVKTLGIYLLASAACIVYKVLVLHYPLNGTQLFWGIFDFTTANYAWYIEMYIGLFLLIPFINLMYNGLPSQRAKLVLVITLVCLTSLPSMVNIYNFDSLEWWKTPYLSLEYRKILPEWWTRLYPLTYYFIGAYLREYPIKLRQWTKLVVWGGCIIAFGAFNFYRSQFGFFSWGKYCDWYGLPNVIMTFFAFSFLASIRTERYPAIAKKLLMQISDLCLGGYLVSFIFDNLFYPILRERVPVMNRRLEWYIVIVPAVFVCSLALSFVLNLIYKGISLACTAICKKIKPAPIENEPVRPVLSENETVRPAPAENEPVKPVSAENEPVKPVSAENEPVRTAPVENEPVRPAPVTLETERTILRPFRIEDADDMYEYARDPDVGPMAGWQPHDSVEVSRKIIGSFINDGDVWAIELKSTHRVVGSVGLHRTKREGIGYDLELGYVLAKDCWGQGLMPEAAGRLVEHAFKTGAETLLCSHFDGNLQSKRVIEKLGFKFAKHTDNSWKRFDGVMLNENLYLLSAADYMERTAQASERLAAR